MSEYLDKAVEFRHPTKAGNHLHYNCAQAVFCAFAEKAGMDPAEAYRTTANFGSGMRNGATCGAITGGLMAMGALGITDAASINSYYDALKAYHEGQLDCRELLRMFRESPEVGVDHCDNMVYECVKLVEERLS